MRKLALLAMLAACAPWTCAQRMASAPAHLSAPAHPAPPAFHGVRGNFPLGREAGRLFRGPHSEPFGSEFLPLLANWFNPDDLYSAGYPVASPLPYFVMQGGSAPDSVDRQPQSAHESVLLELHGDRYVRVNGSDVDNGVQQLALNPNQEAHASAPRKNSPRASAQDSTNPPAIAAAQSGTPLPPVILVLRDGSRQEVHDYTIADGVLYARGDFYTDGYWTRKIEISTLNIPETLATNNARSVRFVLPSAPNEVITRP